MKVKKIEDFNHDVEIHKNVLSSMPINNQKNLKAYHKKVTELKEEYISVRDEIYREIKNRSSKYFNIKPDARLNDLSEEIKGLDNLALLNPLNSPYEKLGLDNILYRLNHFFKNDLDNLNNDILKILQIFKDVGIVLTSEHFIYSNYAKAYIKELLTDSSIEKMKFVFEELHWKCPDVILHVSMNIRLLYEKNKDKFIEYVNNRQRQYLKDGMTYDDYMLKQENLVREYYDLTHFDKYSILNGFLNSELILNDYTVVNVGKCSSKFYDENTSIEEQKNMINDTKNLLFNIIEYKNYLKYSFIVDDIRKKYSERSSHLGEAAKISKEIDALSQELVKMNETISNGYTKGFLFMKKRVDTEKMILDLNAKVKELSDKYDAYDLAVVYEQMNKYITDTSTIYDVFRFSLSYKYYLRNCIKTSKDDAGIDVVKQIVKEFDEFLHKTNINIIKNVNFNIDSDIAEIISDHYQLLHLKLTKESLSEENLDILIKDLTIIVNNYYMLEQDLNIDLINDLFESKKIIDSEV